MLEKNAEKWGDKVRIVAVSVDEDREGVIKRIEERKWSKIIHYKLNGWDKTNKLIKHFAIRGIPFVCLVDSNGVINYVGHPSTIPLEARINTLLGTTNESKSEVSIETKSEASTETKEIELTQL